MRPLLLSLSLLIGLAFGQAKPISLAIQPFVASSVDSTLGSQFSAALTSRFVNSPGYRVLERNQMDMILKEQVFQQTAACSNESCLVQMGKMLGMDQMVAGQIGLLEKGTYSINAKVMDIESGQILHNSNFIHSGTPSSLLEDASLRAFQELTGQHAQKAGWSKAKLATVSILAVLALGGGGAGIVFDRNMASSKTKYEAANNQPDVLKDKKDVQDAQTLRNVSYIAGASALVIGGVYVIAF